MIFDGSWWGTTIGVLVILLMGFAGGVGGAFWLVWYLDRQPESDSFPHLTEFDEVEISKAKNLFDSKLAVAKAEAINDGLDPADVAQELVDEPRERRVPVAQAAAPEIEAEVVEDEELTRRVSDPFVPVPPARDETDLDRQFIFAYSDASDVVHRRDCYHCPPVKQRRYAWAFTESELDEWITLTNLEDKRKLRPCAVCKPTTKKEAA